MTELAQHSIKGTLTSVVKDDEQVATAATSYNNKENYGHGDNDHRPAAANDCDVGVGVKVKDNKDDETPNPPSTSTSDPTTILLSDSEDSLRKQISKQVLRHKLQKLRHLVVKEAISPAYLDGIFPSLLQNFQPQHVTYNGGVANVKKWKISCYLEVMEGGIPCTNPNLPLKEVFTPLLDTCNTLFLYWYRQQHACGKNSNITKCKRLMTFVTRYTPAKGENALLKHVDGAGKVDGSVVVALPVDRWSGPEEENKFEGGGLTFWDGKERIESEDGRSSTRPREMHYDTKSGDIAFIDRAVWHQADPITKGTRWALVIFYKVE